MRGTRPPSAHSLRQLCLGATLAALLVLTTGCPFATDGLGTNDPNVPATGTTTTSPGDLGLGPGKNSVRFRGTITRANPLGWYDLGTLDPGDRVTVDVQRLNGNLDAVAAIFDTKDELIVQNDDRAPDGSNLNPLIDVVMPGASQQYFLGIIAYPGGSSSGDFETSVTIARGETPPVPRQQVLFLDWAGGAHIDVPNVGTYDLTPFSAEDVGLAASQSAPLKDRVQKIVEERYSGFNLIVLSSDHDAVPAYSHSTMYFGATNPDAFAISQQIDAFNSDPSDVAIVYTGTFKQAFGGHASFEQIAEALGNTVAHETGHLLGLVHTADCNDLMDTTCYNERLLTAQAFGTAKLDQSVWPFGVQNAIEILTWVLGLGSAA